MKHFRISDSASEDIDDIWFYIAKNNLEAADRWVLGMVSRFQKLAVTPDIGRWRKELSQNLRSFPVGRYLIFYRTIDNGVEIVRVLHGARNLPPLFE